MYQKARFIPDQLDSGRRAQWLQEQRPLSVRQAVAAGAMLLFGDEASFAQWGSLGYTWAQRGEQPLIKTSGKRKDYKVFGMLDYFSGRLFWQDCAGRFTAQSYCDFLRDVLAQTNGPIYLIQMGRAVTWRSKRRSLSEPRRSICGYFNCRAIRRITIRSSTYGAM